MPTRRTRCSRWNCIVLLAYLHCLCVSLASMAMQCFLWVCQSLLVLVACRLVLSLIPALSTEHVVKVDLDLDVFETVVTATPARKPSLLLIPLSVVVLSLSSYEIRGVSSICLSLFLITLRRMYLNMYLVPFFLLLSLYFRPSSLDSRSLQVPAGLLSRPLLSWLRAYACARLRANDASLPY